MDDAGKLVNLIRELVKDEVNKLDDTCSCIVQSVNTDGSLNITIPPDDNTIIKNIVNISKYSFSAGDYAVLYKIKNKINNSFVISRYGNILKEDMFQELRDYINSMNTGSGATTIIQNGGSSGGGGTVKMVNGVYPDENGNVQLPNYVRLFNDEEFNQMDSSGNYINKDEGNIRVTEYIDGKLDCGGW